MTGSDFGAAYWRYLKAFLIAMSKIAVFAIGLRSLLFLAGRLRILDINSFEGDKDSLHFIFVEVTFAVFLVLIISAVGSLFLAVIDIASRRD